MMDMIYAEAMGALRSKARRTRQDGCDWIVKPIPEGPDGGELDPRVYDVQRRMAGVWAERGASMPAAAEQPVAYAKAMRRFMGWDNRDVTGGTVAAASRTLEGTDGPIPVRVYTPPSETGEKRAAIVFFHGGGFIGGTVDVVENPCKCLAVHADAVVLSVDYRLAPEHPFPAGLTDCMDAVRWVAEHADELGVDPSRIGVAGDSAGGNLAAVCALLDRDKDTGLIAYQALIYPTVNMAGVRTDDFEWSLEAYNIRNHLELIEAGLTGLAGGSRSLPAMYLQGKAEPTDPYMSPLLGDLQGLPPALVVVAEFDYLRLENEAYARKLARSGVPTTLIRYNGTDHAFIDKIGEYPQAEDCMIEIAADFRMRLSANGPRQL